MIDSIWVRAVSYHCDHEDNTSYDTDEYNHPLYVETFADDPGEYTHGYRSPAQFRVKIELPGRFVDSHDLGILLTKLKSERNRQYDLIASYAHKTLSSNYHLYRGIVRGLGTAIMAIEGMMEDDSGEVEG
jgi:hypothetical protein